MDKDSSKGKSELSNKDNILENLNSFLKMFLFIYFYTWKSELQRDSDREIFYPLFTPQIAAMTRVS